MEIHPLNQSRVDRPCSGSWGTAVRLASGAAWVGANSPLHTQLDPVTWRSVALQLSVARIYE